MIKKKFIMLRRCFSTVRQDMHKLGIHKPSVVHHNLDYPSLFEHEVKNGEGVVMRAKWGDTFAVDTGKFTGRSPKDKWIVKTPGSESAKNIWWGEVNQPLPPEHFDSLLDKALRRFNTLDECYVYDGVCGVSSSRKVRFYHEMAWQQHFVKNMFIDSVRPVDDDDSDPDFTIINACSETNEEWEKMGLNSEVAVAFHLEKKLAVILGTWYGGENKKGIFSLMNYWLPLEGIMPMHCSANVDEDGNSALFFGLSGTGKTTLSADPKRALIGDDEHGWDDDGVFNFEGGCYAKTINLTEEQEPDIYRAIRKNALLENVFQSEDGSPDYFNVAKTENGRVSYPIDHIDNWHDAQKAGHPKHIIFLTCDAFGVLPPVSKLTPEQAMYHFLCGYTAKVAGTERGITEPVATFSSCFGAAFLTLHPTKYAELFKDKMREHGSKAYLVNTGWTGGGVDVGKRMALSQTRACIDAILDDSIEDAEFVQDSLFGFEFPKELPGVGADVCNPRLAWESGHEYDLQAEKLANMFEEQYTKYE